MYILKNAKYILQTPINSSYKVIEIIGIIMIVITIIIITNQTN